MALGEAGEARFGHSTQATTNEVQGHNRPAPLGCCLFFRHAALLLRHLESPDFLSRALPGEKTDGNAAIRQLLTGPSDQAGA